ncbi:zn 2cys6 transcription factor [Paraphaeosphaeria minitans]|uniref:Zn 2cys6 transcription factor n=1 Tax=Paraphaeosphaeria minitans TaxID=565426 RepID=A0A9P6KR39_9PLEO|nr:zn 2cys6 transcription factor [Paraphaeosphaeria minitans]
MRSRTGCLTCRQRKLKCDEKKPVCSQCCKASRECIPSSGIVFRHQHNASMNGEDSGDDNSLKGFYAYRNTFDEETIWLDIPRNVTFINTTNPYLDPDFDNMSIGSADSPSSFEPRSVTSWPAHNKCSTTTSTPISGPLHNPPMCYTPELEALPALETPSMLQSPPTSSVGTPISPPIALATHFRPILHHSLSMTPPPVDPQLASPMSQLPDQIPRSSSMSTSQRTLSYTSYMSDRDYETAYLLRWFSEGPGYWMDLYDLGTYFSSYVPVKAQENLLLKYAALAYSAKALGRVQSRKPVMGGSVTRQSQMDMYPDTQPVDWPHKATQYYDMAVSLLLKALKANALSSPDSDSDGGDSSYSFDDRSTKRRRTSGSNATGSTTDELLAASAILCVYEFLDGSDKEWTRHLKGAKSLLVVAQERLSPMWLMAADPITSSANLGLVSKARRATFWNIARQDMLAAFINKTRTRLDTEDISLWREFGLILNDDGFIVPNHAVESAYSDGDSIMKEDLICNSLVWLMGKLVNFMAYGQSTWAGVSQKTLLDYWTTIQRQFQMWHDSLPITFKPSARVDPRPAKVFGEQNVLFPEIWYSIPMCASTMQYYHMSLIQLFMNKPHQTTQGATNVYERLNSYQSDLDACQRHSREIVGISLGRPDDAVRINSVQPLFTAGQCLGDIGERQVVLGLLGGIESDIGWATEYRARQLIEQWHWEDSDQSLVT